jgi:septum site-determining protein MinC
VSKAVTDSIDDGTGLDEGFTDGENGAISGVILGDSARVVTARGTEDGLVLRIDGKAEWQEILNDLELFLGKRRKFLEGGQVSLEWLERLPTREQSKELEDLLKNRYGIEVSVRRRRSSNMRLAKGENVSKQQQTKNGGVTIPLFDEVPNSAPAGSSALDTQAKDGAAALGYSEGRAYSGQTANRGQMMSLGANDLYGLENGAGTNKGGSYISAASKRYLSQMTKLLGDDAYYEEDANAKIVFGTLRSGQRFETPFSLIVVGDVNPGADLIAGGDIIVLGSLRGTAHASAYDDDSFDHVIIALRMQPMQLRIGSVISRGSDEQVKGAEIARIENRRIIVEPFSARDFLARKVR